MFILMYTKCPKLVTEFLKLVTKLLPQPTTFFLNSYLRIRLLILERERKREKRKGERKMSM